MSGLIFVVKTRLPFDVLAIERKGVAAQVTTVFADFAKLNFNGSGVGVGGLQERMSLIRRYCP